MLYRQRERFVEAGELFRVGGKRPPDTAGGTPALPARRLLQPFEIVDVLLDVGGDEAERCMSARSGSGGLPPRAIRVSGRRP